MDLVGMIRKGQLRAQEGAEIRMDGHRIRPSDGTRYTSVPLAKRKQARRAKRKAAKR